jgi:UPF0716 family protein affecting phage T7 exclusion
LALLKWAGFIALGLFVDVIIVVTLSATLGVLPMLGVSLVTAVLGAVLAFGQGWRVLRQWREALSQGRLPDEGVIGSLLVLIGGILLCLPGVLTDVAGLVLLVPASRKRVADYVRARLARRFNVVTHPNVEASPDFAAEQPRGGFRVVGVHAGTWSAREEDRADVIDVEGHAVDDGPQSKRLLPP